METLSNTGSGRKMKTIEAIEDAVDAGAIAKGLGQLVVRSKDGYHTIARKKEWIAVPAESSCHLNVCDQERLARTYRDTGSQTVWAVRLEDILLEPLAYQVQTTIDGLHAFNRACAQFNYCLCDPEYSSLVICTTDDYLVFAGTPEFVRAACGVHEAEAFVAFGDYVKRTSEVWPQMTDFFESVHLALFEDYPRAEAGQWVEFPRR